jgi:hypothetical protein
VSVVIGEGVACDVGELVGKERGIDAVEGIAVGALQPIRIMVSHVIPHIHVTCFLLDINALLSGSSQPYRHDLLNGNVLNIHRSPFLISDDSMDVSYGTTLDVKRSI